jgi:hypothetical protein
LLDLVGEDLFDALRDVVVTACACTGGEKSSLAVLDSQQVLDGFTGERPSG